MYDLGIGLIQILFPVDYTDNADLIFYLRTSAKSAGDFQSDPLLRFEINVFATKVNHSSTYRV